MNNHVFSRNLRRLRTEKGLTQETLAEALGVSSQSVSRWECGSTLPDVMLLPEIARLYGITVDDLYRKDARAYANYAQRLLSVYEATRRTEDFLAAEQEFTRLLAAEHTADDLRGLGVMYHYMAKDSASKAEKYLNAALDKADKSHWVWSSSAQQKISLLCDLGRGREAAEYWERELRLAPNDALNWLLATAALHYSGDSRQAYLTATEALERFPDNAALEVYTGNICRELGHYEEAFSHWQRCLELDKDFCDARYSTGFCHEELGQYGKALAVWESLEREMLAKGYVLEAKLPGERAAICREKIG